MKYKPKMAFAGLLGILSGLVIFGFTIWGIDFSLGENDRTLKIMLYLPTYLFLFIYTYLILGAFSLSYKIENDALIINWGLQKIRIEWDQFVEIIDVQGRANLYPFLAFSWPGYMVGLYSAGGLGSVRMYAGNTQEGFIYLKTKKGLFGISPDQAFITELLNKNSKTITVVDMDKMPLDKKGEAIHEDLTFKLYYKLNVIFLVLFAGYLAIFFPGSEAPRFIILLLVLALALFAFNGSNSKRLYQFSSQGACIILLISLAVTGIFIILSVYGISMKV